MDEVVRSYYDDYKNTIIFLLRPTGMWPSKSKRSIILDTIRPAMAILLVIIVILEIVCFTIYNIRNIMLFVVGFRNFINLTSSLFKMLIMILMRREVIILNDGLTATFESDLKVPEYRKHLLYHYRAFYRLYKIFFYMGMHLIFIAYSVRLRNLLSGKFIPMHTTRVPFDYTLGGPVYYAIVVVDFLSGAIIMINSIGTDSLFGLYALHMVGELRLLSHRFRNLRPGENYRRQLKDCIDRHNLLIRYKYVMNQVFGFLCVWLAISCAIGVCSMIFQITRTHRSMTLFRKFITVDVLILKFMQAYTYAWYGNAITVESEKCVESIYHSDWPVSADLRFKKDVNIIQLQSPIHISGMGILNVQLDLFANIIRASISYFFILETLEEKFT